MNRTSSCIQKIQMITQSNILDRELLDMELSKMFLSIGYDSTIGYNSGTGKTTGEVIGKVGRNQICWLAYRQRINKFRAMVPLVIADPDMEIMRYRNIAFKVIEIDKIEAFATEMLNRWKTLADKDLQKK